MDERSDPWRGRRVLVTGCTGFLGGEVVRGLLARGAEVIGLVRDRAGGAEFARHGLAGRVHVIHGRAEDTFRVHSALAVYEARAVFHFAATDRDRIDRGTPAVVEAVRRYDPRIPVLIARPADSAALPTLPVPLGVARFGEVFGGDPNLSRVVPAAVLGQLTGDRSGPSLDGRPRDFVFVRDAARACVALAEAVAARPAPHLHDATFRSGWSFTPFEVVAAAREVTAGRVLLGPVAEPSANPLGWEPAGTFAAALAETIDWYRQFLTARVFHPRPSEPPHRAVA